jgi:hypothetical protein
MVGCAHKNITLKNKYDTLPYGENFHGEYCTDCGKLLRIIKWIKDDRTKQDLLNVKQLKIIKDIIKAMNEIDYEKSTLIIDAQYLLIKNVLDIWKITIENYLNKKKLSL